MRHDPVITIRQATDDDLPMIRQLRREWTIEQYGTDADADFDRRFAEWYAIEAHRRIVWLADHDDQPVGMVNLVVFERMPRPGQPSSRWGYLGNTFVLPDHRNRGIGRRLVTTLLAYATAHDFARVVLSPTTRSIPFYTRVGFEPADMLLVHQLGNEAATTRA
jgi:GNAT superfamily N-acetyltransferase